MARKKKKQEKETTIENYYDLRTEAVDDLVEALRTGESKEEISTNIAEITGEQVDAKPGSKKAEFNPYKRDKLANIPVWIKALFIKWWFAGCVCYFVMMGLGYYITNDIDLMCLTALVYGIIVDLFVNPIYRFMESPEKEYNAYMMFPFPFKAFWTFFANIIYYFGVIFLVNVVTNLINLGGLQIWLSPLVFATLTMVVDMAFIGIKDLIVHLVKRAKEKTALEAAKIDAAVDEGFVLNANDGKAKGAFAKTKGAKAENGATSANGENPETGATAENGGAAQDNAGENSAEPEDEIDEIERLRRIAVESSEGKKSNGKNKNKKK